MYTCGVPLTTVYPVRRAGFRAYSGLMDLTGALKGFRAEAGVFNELWAFLKVRRGPGRTNLWVWVFLVDLVPFFTVGDRDYGTLYGSWSTAPMVT